MKGNGGTKEVSLLKSVGGQSGAFRSSGGTNLEYLFFCDLSEEASVQSCPLATGTTFYSLQSLVRSVGTQHSTVATVKALKSHCNFRSYEYS